MQQKYIPTNPNRKNEWGYWTPAGTDSSQPQVSTSLKPIDREDSSLEAEAGEISVAPDLLSIHKVLGKPHSQGGTPLNLPDGSFIYSKDRSLHLPIKVQEQFGLKTSNSSARSDNTPAKVLERNVDLKHHNTMSAILQDPKKRDMVSKNTAQVMVQKNAEKMGQVAYLQEAKKDFRDGVPPISEGTQPVFNQEVKDQITTEDQYMRHGGYYYEKGGRKKPSYNMYSPAQQKQIESGLLAVPPYSNSVSNPFGVQHSNGSAYGQIGSNQVSPFQNFNWWLYGHNPNATASDFQQNYTDNIDPNYSSYGFSNTDQTPLNNVDNKLGNYTATRPLPFKQMSQRDLNLMQSIGAARPYQYNNQPYYQVQDSPALYSPTSPTLPAPQSANVTPSFLPQQSNQPAQPQNGLTPPNLDLRGGVYTDQRVPFNTGQLADLAATMLINGMRKNIYPKRQQDTFVPVELQQLNPNQALQENSNNWLAAARIASATGSTPAQAALQQSMAAQGITNANRIRNDYDSQNVQISNQQNLYNNQGFNQIRSKNVDNTAQYNQQVDAVVGRANQEQMHSMAQFQDKALGYYGENQQLRNYLNAQQQFPVYNPDGTPVLNQQGQQVYNTPYSYVDGNYRFNGVNGFNMVQGQKQNVFDAQIKMLQEQINNTTDERAKALQTSNLVKLLTSAQTPYRNKMGGYVRRKK